MTEEERQPVLASYNVRVTVRGDVASPPSIEEVELHVERLAKAIYGEDTDLQVRASAERTDT